MSEGFILKRWDVTVVGYGSGFFAATSRGKALADAWRCDAFSGWTFAQFLKRANCIRMKEVTEFWGIPITIGGKPAFFVDSNKAYVQFVYPGKDLVLSAHPLEVLPESYRPEAYRSAAA